MTSTTMTYAEAISDALEIAIRSDPKVRILGIGVDYSAGIFGTTRNAYLENGKEKVVDTPAMENALTGIAAGAALVGLRPVVVHARNDFAFLALDQIINVYSKWHYMFDGKAGSLPVVTRLLVGRGWGQGATHSQSIQSLIGHFPGIRVVMPATPTDAKGMLLSSLSINDPTIIIEHRNLYNLSSEVPSGFFTRDLFGAEVVSQGTDITIVATSICVPEAVNASKTLAANGISCEVIDLRVIQPLDTETVLESVRKTRRIIFMDTSWVQYGVSAEVFASILEDGNITLLSPGRRLGQAPNPAPVSQVLEEIHYPTSDSLVQKVFEIMGKNHEPGTTSRLNSASGINNPY
jgi:pyruvate dehydrogenase E1 component beta subunit